MTLVAHSANISHHHPASCYSPASIDQDNDKEILKLASILVQLAHHNKKKRLRTSPDQLDILEQAFEQNHTPDQETRLRLSRELGMTSRRIQIWFQNKRAKMKKTKGSADSRRARSPPLGLASPGSSLGRHRRRRSSDLEETPLSASEGADSSDDLLDDEEDDEPEEDEEEEEGEEIGEDSLPSLRFAAPSPSWAPGPADHSVLPGFSFARGDPQPVWFLR